MTSFFSIPFPFASVSVCVIFHGGIIKQKLGNFLLKIGNWSMFVECFVFFLRICVNSELLELFFSFSGVKVGRNPKNAKWNGNVS